MASVVRGIQAGSELAERDGGKNCGGPPRRASAAHGEKFCWISVDAVAHGELNCGADRQGE